MTRITRTFKFFDLPADSAMLSMIRTLVEYQLSIESYSLVTDGHLYLVTVTGTPEIMEQIEMMGRVEQLFTM